MTRGSNFRGNSAARYRREVREPLTALRAWLPRSAWTSAGVRAILEQIMEDYPEVGQIPFKPAPATRAGLTCCRLRITREQRGMIDLIALLHGVSISEALRGIIAAWMEER
jgi:hypothetical protein